EQRAGALPLLHEGTARRGRLRARGRGRPGPSAQAAGPAHDGPAPAAFGSEVVRAHRSGQGLAPVDRELVDGVARAGAAGGRRGPRPAVEGRADRGHRRGRGRRGVPLRGPGRCGPAADRTARRARGPDDVVRRGGAAQPGARLGGRGPGPRAGPGAGGTDGFGTLTVEAAPAALFARPVVPVEPASDGPLIARALTGDRLRTRRA